MINARPCSTKVTCTVLVPNVAPVTAEEPAGFFSSEVDDPFIPPPPRPKDPPPPCVGINCNPPPNINEDPVTPYRPRTDDPPPNNPPPTINEDPNTPVFLNELQTCGADCPDGSTSEHTVTAGLYRGSTQAQANQIALSICEREAAAQALCFQTESLPDVCKDGNYNQTIVATGGQPHFNFSYDWEIIGGSLPPGITLNPINGSLTGIPTASGAFTFTVQITDAAGQTKSTVLSINVVEITSTATLPSGIVGTAYSGFSFTQTPAIVTGTWTLLGGFFPPGLAINPVSGAVTGTPTAKGVYNFTVAFNFGASSCSKMCTIRIWDSDNTQLAIFGGNMNAAPQILNGGLPYDEGVYQVNYITIAGAVPNFAVTHLPSGDWVNTSGGPYGDCTDVVSSFFDPIDIIRGYSYIGLLPNSRNADVKAATMSLNPILQFEITTPTVFTWSWSMPTVGCTRAFVPGTLGGTGINWELRRIGKA